MKKLFMIAVVACMATFAQAITLEWSAGFGTEGSAWTTGLSSTLVWSGTAKTADEITADLLAGEVAAVANSSTWDNVKPANGEDPASLLSFVTVEGVTEPQKTGTYFLVFATTDAYYVSSLDAALSEDCWDLAGKTPDKTAIGSDFTKVAVPEPTALALLALGVAGVALRRRRRA